LLGDDAVSGIVINSRDITDRKEIEARLAHDAMHDGLTGLANRTVFMDRLTLALKQYERYPDQAFGILYLDLNGFKPVNDQFGHAAGDQVLIETAHRLLGCIRPSDTVARLGGDEFALLLGHIKASGESTVVADRVQKAIRRPYYFDGHEMRISTSIGIALSSAGYADPVDMVRDADHAMYLAKRKSKEEHAR
jgi:diguanylate cyclase (GGDEF)-like protein